MFSVRVWVLSGVRVRTPLKPSRTKSPTHNEPFIISSKDILWKIKPLQAIICQDSFRETCQWLKFPLNGLSAQSKVSPVVGLLPLASGPACLRMAFPPFLRKHLYHCDSVVISSFVRTGYTTRRGGWLLGRIRIGYSITHHYPFFMHHIESNLDIL